jgi:hypothetical protein
MSNGLSRRWRVTFGASFFAFILSADMASAQYYYPYGGRSYDRDYYYGRRPAPPRDMDSYLRDRRRPLARDYDDDLPRPSKPKRQRIEDAKIDNAKNSDKPIKGPYHIVISINHQSISLYGANGLIRQSKVSTGMRGHGTPTGVFTVIGKESFHRSNIYSGAPMPLMQRITWSGIALHQGVLPGYPASHGCIRMNGEFAQFLYKTTRIGARVIIAQDDLAAPVEISNAKLPAPTNKPTEQLVTMPSVVKAATQEAKRAVRVAEVQEQETNAISTAVDAKTNYFKQRVVRPRSGPVSVFISRKTGKLYVRHAYAPLFDVPIVIQRADQPIGTQVFTAMEANEDGKSMRWVVTSIPTPATSEAVADRKNRRNSRDNVVADISTKPAVSVNEPQTAVNALDRIEIPKEAAERISEILTPGSTFMISDYGISDETGLETDFIVLTR